MIKRRNIMNKLLLLPFFIFLLILSGCSSGTIWTGQTYSGTVTKDGNSGLITYYDSYYIYCSGTWQFDLTSKDNVEIFLDGEDLVSRQPRINNLYAKAGTNSVTALLSGFTQIDVCVYSTNSDWANNGNKAGYSFTATLIK
jgi:hypothetical protein